MANRERTRGDLLHIATIAAAIAALSLAGGPARGQAVTNPVPTPRTGYNPYYPRTGYNTGYPQTGYNTGYPRTGYNAGYSGYPQMGYNNSGRTGYNTLGRTGYNTGYPGMGGYNTLTRNPRTGQFTGQTAGRTTGRTLGRTPGRTTGRATPTPTSGRTGRNRNVRATPTPPGTAPGATASTRPGGQPQTVVKGRQPAPSKKGATSKGPAVTAQFAFKPLPETAVVYVLPFQANVAVGEEYDTRVSLANPGGKEFQEIEITLQFNPLVLEPIRLDDDAVRPLLEGDAEAFVFIEPGILNYRASLVRPTTAMATEFFTVRWKCLGISPRTEIRFVPSWRHCRTALLDKLDKDVLGGIGSDGSLGASLQIYSPEQLADGPPIGEELFAGATEAKRGDVELRLVTNKQKIPASEDFYVGVWFDNPRMVEISKIAFRVRFDPRVLEVVDDDADNWITTGVNIFDGEYHDRFPFDMHLQNRASNEIGLITYAMASTKKRALNNSGYLARIRFRPKRLANTTKIEFEFEPETDPFRTQVVFLGADVLGQPDVAGDGVENLAVSIVKPEVPRLLTAEK